MNRKKPNSAHATKPGTTRSKNSNQSIEAEDNNCPFPEIDVISGPGQIQRSGREPGKEVQKDFVETMSLLDVAEVGSALKQIEF